MEHEILNVLIVEDEEPIREDLTLFPWDECGALLVGEAANGRDALEISEDSWPDIVVTDITMPEMDGLALMEHMRSTRPNTQFIVLTCHADFRYAQKALRLGAVDYVVKAGLRDEDLKRAIDKAREALTTRRQSQQGQWREGYWERTAEIREFVNAGTDPTILSELPGRLVALHCISQRTDAIFVSRYILRNLAAEGRCRWFSPGGNRYACIDGEADEATAKRRMLQLVDTLQRGVVEDLTYLGGEVRFFASVSNVLEDRRDLLDALSYLDVYRDYAFYQERLRVVVGRVQQPVDATDAQWDALDLELRRAERSAAELAGYLGNSFLVWARRARIKQDQLKSILVSRRESWKRQYDIRATDERFWTRLSGVATLRDLCSLVSGEVNGGSDRGASQMRPELRQARKIIKRRYADPLSLERVAEEVGWSPSYLSRVFRRETGKTFKECVTETRIGRAMEMLRTPGIKVYEVAERVGFPSYRQFSIVFKGLTGVRPKEFQKGGRHEA